MSVQAMSAALAARGLTPSEKLLLIALANYADAENQCWPSHKRLADDTGLSQRTILTVFKRLEAALLVQREARPRSDGSRSTDLVTLRLGGEMISPRGETTAPPVGKWLQGGGETASPLTTFEPSTEPRTSEANASSGARLIVDEDLSRPREKRARSRDAASKVEVPDDWQPDQAQRQRAIDRGIGAEEVDLEAEKFRSHHGARGNKFQSLDKAWTNWVCRHRSFQPSRGSGGGDDRLDAKNANYARSFAGATMARRGRDELLALSEVPDAPTAIAELEPATFVAAWQAYPHHPGRSSRRDSLTSWAALPPSEQTALPRAAEVYAAAERRRTKRPDDVGAPAMERWIVRELWANWLEIDAPLAPVTTFAGPLDLRRSVVSRAGEDFARSYLDPSGWREVPFPALVPRTRFGAEKLQREVGEVLSEFGVTIQQEAA